ncbi:MAG: thiamine pyrophosphate-binding protein [Chloroflexi bacterium]|nr:thiamine pyrophosphate-binding protein [Chloroflexota bacterium]
MLVYEAAAGTLARLGVDVVFGVMGHGNVRVITQLERVRYVAARHENSAVAMADGYARVSGRAGVCSVTEGPGVTNALTGLTEAAKAHTPLLMLAGDSPAVRQRDNQHVDVGAFVAAAGVPSRRLTDASTLVECLAGAYHQAVAEQTPMVAILPQDAQMAELPEEPDWERLLALPERRCAQPNADAVAEVADMLAAAAKPVILAGRGALRSGAKATLTRLAERSGAVLATTAQAKGLFAGEPYHVGTAGGFSTAVAVDLFRQTDLLLAFGASLTAWTTRAGSLFPQAKVVQCDVRPEAVAPGRTGLVGDAKLTAAALDAELARRGHRARGFRSPEAAEGIAGYRAERTIADQSANGRVDPDLAMARLNQLLPAERTIALDSGMFLGAPAIHLNATDEAGFIFSNDYQAMGLGLGLAIGAAVARPDRLPVAVVGDGGLMMSLGDLETAVRLGIPLLLVVANDAAYGAEIRLLESIGQPPDHAFFDDVDFAAVGRGLGTDGLTVRRLADFDGLTGWLERPDRPMVVDCKMVRGARAAWFEEALKWMGR